MTRSTPTRDCEIEGCVRKAPQRGLCPAHYQRWRKYGDPLGLAPKRAKRPVREIKDLDQATIDRFWIRVAKGEGCWEWQGAIQPVTGYGAVRIDDKARSTHRVAYELSQGPIPEGIFIDHRCGNRTCVRPDHLRLATPKQNTEHHTVLRSDNKSGVRGVCWSEQAQRWLVQVSHNGKRVFCRTYKSLAEAEAAAIAKRNELFTHNDLDRRAA